jgi:hypothetical protein
MSAAVLLSLLGVLATIAGLSILYDKLKGLIAESLSRGELWPVLLINVFRTVGFAVSLVVLLLLVAGAIGIAWDGFPIAVGLFVAMWISIWDNIADAYHADRIVKFLVWLAAATGAGLATVLSALMLPVGISFAIGSTWSWFEDFWRESRPVKSNNGDSRSVGDQHSATSRRKTLRGGLVGLGLLLLGLLAIGAGALLAAA